MMFLGLIFIMLALTGAGYCFYRAAETSATIDDVDPNKKPYKWPNPDAGPKWFR